MEGFVHPEYVNDLRLERNLFKRRSEDYRNRYLDLEGKVTRLEEMLKESKTKKKQLKKKFLEEKAELEAQLTGACETIDTLKGLVNEEKKEKWEILKECNERGHQVHELKSALETLRSYYKKAMDCLDTYTNENELIKEVNARFLGEIKRLNTQLNQ
jgi:chromosome segregation ATPase